MIYSSISGHRGHRDPQPFIILETNERAGFDELGQVGKTMVFSPRLEFMPSRYHKTNEILDLSRDLFQESNPWGSGRQLLAQFAELLKQRNERLPMDLELQLPPAAAHVDVSYFNELVDEIEEEEFLRQLKHAAEVMSRLVHLADLNGALKYREPSAGIKAAR